MKTAMGCAAVFPTLATPTTSEAKACLKGAVIEGAAGHFARHHGNLGAAGGLRIQP
jgi:hypothetical protein